LNVNIYQGKLVPTCKTEMGQPMTEYSIESPITGLGMNVNSVNLNEVSEKISDIGSNRGLLSVMCV